MRTLEDIIVHYPAITGVHPACRAVPPMAEAELLELVADIKAHGLKQPILLTGDGLLLDGRHRLIACHQASQELKFDHTDEAPWELVLSLNIRRRHLTTGQIVMFGQAMLAHEEQLAKERQRAAGKQHGRGRKKVQPILAEAIPQARDKVAAALGVGKTTMGKGKVIIEYAPAVAEQVQNGQTSPKHALRYCGNKLTVFACDAQDL